MHVQGLGGPEPHRLPDLTHQLLAGDDLALLAHQDSQQVELLGGQLKLLLVEEGTAGIRVYTYDRIRCVGVIGLATKQRTHPCQ